MIKLNNGSRISSDGLDHSLKQIGGPSYLERHTKTGRLLFVNFKYFQLEGLKQIQDMLTSGGAEMAQRYQSSIISSCFYQGAHRSVRLHSYKLIR